jgi:hypothetical protein
MISGSVAHVRGRDVDRESLDFARWGTWVLYFGATYHYGRPAKKDKKEKAIQYEDQP